MAGGDLRDGGAGLRRRLPRAQGLPSRAARPTTCARGRASRRARSSSTSTPEGPRRRQRARASRARSTSPAFRGRGRRAGRRAGCAPASASRSRPCSGSPTRTRAWSDARARARAAGVRGPDAAAVGAGHARVRDPARRAAPRGRHASSSTTSSSAPSATAARVSALRARVGLREERRGADWVVLATGGFASGGLELDSRWTARETALGLPVTGVPGPGEERFRPDYFDDQPIGARRRGGRTRELRPVDAAGERVFENVLVAGATLAGAEPWREKSGDGISLATGYRAAELICPRRPPRPRRARPRPRGAERMAIQHDDDVLGDAADARVARPLRQVHDLRDVLPGLQRDAAVPGAEVRRAAGRALPRRRRAVVGRLAGLLLGLRGLHPGLPAGRPHRRDQHPGPGEDEGDERACRCATACSARPTLAGRLGTPAAPLANWSLRQPPAAARARAGHRHRTTARRCRRSPGRTFQRWARKHARRRRRAQRVAYFHGCGDELLRAAARAR